MRATKYNTSTCYSRNFKTLASLISWAGRFESYLVANPKDRFSRDVAQIISVWTVNEALIYAKAKYLPLWTIRTNLNTAV